MLRRPRQVHSEQFEFLAERVSLGRGFVFRITFLGLFMRWNASRRLAAIAGSILFTSTFSLAAAPSSQPASKLSLRDLVTRRETWPTEVTLPNGYAGMAPGTVLTVTDFTGRLVDGKVKGGILSVSVPVQATNFIEAANAKAMGFVLPQAPAISELTMDELARRKDLWPDEVTLNRDVPLGTGVIPSGTKYPVETFDGHLVFVKFNYSHVPFTVDSCDFVEQAKAKAAALAAGTAKAANSTSVRAEEGVDTVDANGNIVAAKPANAQLSLNDLSRARELWPKQVSLVKELHRPDGSTVPVGTKYFVTAFDGITVIVQKDQTSTPMRLPATLTDFQQAANARIVNGKVKLDNGLWVDVDYLLQSPTQRIQGIMGGQ